MLQELLAASVWEGDIQLHLVIAEHLHFLYLSFPEPPSSTVFPMVIIAVLVVPGAVVINVAVVAFVRRNKGGKGQGLSFLSASFSNVLCS